MHSIIIKTMLKWGVNSNFIYQNYGYQLKVNIIGGIVLQPAYLYETYYYLLWNVRCLRGQNRVGPKMPGFVQVWQKKLLDLVVWNWRKLTLSDWPVLGLPLHHCSCRCWCRNLDKMCRTDIRMNQRAESEKEQACHFFAQTDLLVILGARYRRLVNLRW